jgi:hypothetical protein
MDVSRMFVDCKVCWMYGLDSVARMRITKQNFGDGVAREMKRVGAKRNTEPRRLSFHPYPVEIAPTVKLCSHAVSLGQCVLNSDALQESIVLFGFVKDMWGICFVCSSMQTAKCRRTVHVAGQSRSSADLPSSSLDTTLC